MLTEFDYYQHTGRQSKTGLGGVDHFISKITDCTQQSKKSRPRLRLSVPLPRPLPPAPVSTAQVPFCFVHQDTYKN